MPDPTDIPPGGSDEKSVDGTGAEIPAPKKRLPKKTTKKSPAPPPAKPLPLPIEPIRRRTAHAADTSAIELPAAPAPASPPPSENKPFLPKKHFAASWDTERTPSKPPAVTPRKSRQQTGDTKKGETTPDHPEKPKQIGLMWKLIGALIAGLIAIVGLTWVSYQQAELGDLRRRIREANTQIHETEKRLADNQDAAFAGKPVEAGWVEGRILYPELGNLGEAGAEVVLLDPDKVRMAMELATHDPVANSSLGMFFRRLPSGYANTITDSKGIFRLPLPHEGSFVLACRLQAKRGGRVGEVYWMVSFDSERAAERPILLTPSNRLRQIVPGLPVQPAG